MSDTVKDFLVGLGWSSKPNEQRQFEGAIESATLKAKLLGDALEEVARKVLDSVSNIAENFDRLYFQAQRTNTAAATVSDFVTVMAKMGVSAGDASSSVENMARHLREGTASVTDINKMGWGLNPLTGQLEINKQYLANMSGMSTAILEGYAARVGMSDNVMMAERRMGAGVQDEMDKLVAYRNSLGFDPAKAEADANAFMTVWRKTYSELQAIGNDIGAGLTKALTAPLQAFDKFLTDNSEAIGKDITMIGAALLSMTTAWVKDFEDISKDPRAFDDFRSGMHDFAGAIKDLADNFHGFVADLIWLNGSSVTPGSMLNQLLAVVNPSTADISKGLREAPPETGVPDDAGGWGDWARRLYKTVAPTWAGGTPARKESDPTGIPYNATSMTAGTGFSAAQYGAFKEGLTDIEGKRYDRMGGAGGHYAGRYQMGPGEIAETAARLGISTPTQADFLANPELQEQFMENYTLEHYRQLMKNPRFAAMSKTEQLQMLGYAHNQGVGGANRYLDTGAAGRDAFGTSGTAYFAPIGKRLAAIDAVPVNAGLAGGDTSADGIVTRLQKMKAAGLISNDECVSLAAAAVGLGPGQWNVHDWRRAESAAAGTLTPGQPLATFLDAKGNPSDRYAGGGSGTPGANRDHAGVFQSYILDAKGNRIGFNMAEQYDGSGGIHSKAYYFGRGLGEGDASNYSAIRSAATGTYLGDKTAQAPLPAPSRASSDSLQPFTIPPQWSLGGDASPLLGGAGEAGGATIHAPMDTKIVVEGGSGNPTPTAPMVAAGIPQAPADLTRNLQGAHN